MMNNYTVYMHISPSGKRYIGITSMEPEKRWKNGKGYIGNQHFTNAIEKYGWDNFEHIIIAKGLSEQQAKEMEIKLIRVWDSANQDKGYNISLGGDGCRGVNPRDFMTEEAKKEHDRKISEANKGKNPWENMTDEQKEETKRKMSEARKGETHTEEHNRKVSEALKGKYCGENNHMYGKKGKNHPQAKSVITIINDKIFGVFDYIKQGAEYFNCHHGNISQCCNGKRKSSGKYNGIPLVWRYIEIIEL